MIRQLRRLVDEFGIDLKEVIQLLREWMETFRERHPA